MRGDTDAGCRRLPDDADRDTTLRGHFAAANHAREIAVATDWFEREVAPTPAWQSLLADPRVADQPELVADLRRQTIDQLAVILAARWEPRADRRTR